MALRSMILRLAAAAIAVSQSLIAMPVSDGDMTLSPPPPPKPKVLGIEFGAGPNEIVSLMQAQRVGVQTQKTMDVHGVTKLLVFNGVPRGVVVEEGTSQFFFFKGELIRMTFAMQPSYANFLQLRNQLLASLGDQYSVVEKKETMDAHLRMRLSSLDHGAFKEEAENLIKESIAEGKTFFYYQIKDRANELAITLAYTDNHSITGGEPSLSLHYDHNPGITKYQAFQEQYRGNSSQSAGGSAPLIPQAQ